MRTMQVFDPASCCGTGAGGLEVDQTSVAFSADAARAASR